MTQADVLELCGLFETNFHFELNEPEKALWANRLEHVPNYLLGEAGLRIVDNELRAPRIATVFRYVNEVRAERAASGMEEGRSARQSMKVMRERIEMVYKSRHYAQNDADYTKRQAAEDLLAQMADDAAANEARGINADDERRWVVAIQYILDEELA